MGPGENEECGAHKNNLQALASELSYCIDKGVEIRPSEIVILVV